MMKPILFNTEMVRAILDGRKTATRRLIKDVTGMEFRGTVVQGDRRDIGKVLFRLLPDEHRFISVPCKIGDILYVRETWNINNMNPETNNIGVIYKADNIFRWCHVSDVMYERYESGLAESNYAAWRPSIHMPKEFARIFLKVTDVRVERLQDIANDEYGDSFRSEGMTSLAVCGGVDKEIASAEFGLLWNSTIPKKDIEKHGWEANPWVWVIEFERSEG